MCFNYKVSLLTFGIGIIFSIILIKYGNTKYILENKTFGIFYLFIALIQFMDFLFWIDLHNTIGINKITTILGPILNVLQPNILYLIKILYYKPNINISPTLGNFNLQIAILNCLYFLYFIIFYKEFLTTDKLITQTTKTNHLEWPWIKYANPYFYIILLTVNIFYLSNFKYALVTFLITFAFLIISVKYFNYNIGELWCFFGAFSPAILYFLSFHI